MSVSIGGCHPGYAHPGNMGVSSPEELYASHYHSQFAAAANSYPDFHAVDHRDPQSYVHSWIVAGATEMQTPPSPETYGTMCGTPSPNTMCHNPLGYDMFNVENHNSYKQWQDIKDINGGSTVVPPFSELGQYDTYTNSFGERCYRRRTSANKKERRRTVSINNAFTNLRGTIPNVPSDTKLSKIKTLKLAISYISYLNEVLEKGDSKLAETGFKADISRKRGRRSEAVKRPADSCESDDSNGSSNSAGAGGDAKRCRTGWPQEVWASELKSSPQ